MPIVTIYRGAFTAGEEIANGVARALVREGRCSRLKPPLDWGCTKNPTPAKESTISGRYGPQWLESKLRRIE
jgi:hypothetical protein